MRDIPAIHALPRTVVPLVAAVLLAARVTRRGRAELGNPATGRERLRRISPHFHADRITKPFLVLQGANDRRVLPRESEDIVEAARANGVAVEYIVFPDEGHGFQKKENQRRAYEAVLGFLDRHLKGVPE